MSQNVTWASSQTRAERYMREADEHLEFERWDKAMECLAAAQRELTATVEFVLRTKYEGASAP